MRDAGVETARMEERGEDMEQLLKRIERACRSQTGGGKPASYIPELANVDPGLFSLSVTGIGGGTCTVGDGEAYFSMQSISKVVSLAFAIERFGEAGVFSRVGMEPCAEPFNSIMKLEIASNMPLNPFINAGAIVLSAMICERFGGSAIGEVLDFASRMASRGPGKRLAVNERIYISENATADRNRALAYYMHSTDALSHDVEETLALYFRMCSIETRTGDLSRMGATIANAGLNPVTGERVISRDTARILVGLMATCGLYNESGEFAVRVGVPAKSGVCGGVLGTVPGRMGLAVFSPPLDERGNSVAGIEALAQLSEAMGLRGFPPA